MSSLPDPETHSQDIFNAQSQSDGSSTASTLGEYLIAQGQLSENDLARVRRLLQETEQSTAALLIKLGLASEQVIASAYQVICNLDAVTETEFPVVPVCADKLPLHFQRQYQVIPLREDESVLWVGMAEPDNEYVIQAIRLACGKDVVPRVTTPDLIEKTLARLYEDDESSLNNYSEKISEVESDWLLDDVEKLKDLASEAPVVRLVNLLLQRSIERGASDVHFEPHRNSLKIRYRIDGVLQEVDSPSIHAPAAVVSRIKLMANLNIAERRLPQDGRIQLRSQGREIDLRVSTLPAVHGESVVVRVLDKDRMTFDFSGLGFNNTLEHQFINLLSLPHGIILVSGPTGSGKSTTLYAALHNLNNSERKIVTVEDPVEYHIDGVTQIQVKPKIDLTFAKVLRSVVRHDPDVIMIGEMRDLETASIAVQSALTGHMVLSTLHTNTAAGAITRLLDMGVEDYLLSSTINGIIGQRLVRKLCKDCMKSFRPEDKLIKQLDLQRIAGSSEFVLYHSDGCSKCLGTGYKGRTVILELMTLTDDIRHLIVSRAEELAIEKAAIDAGMKTLRDYGLKKAVEGVTSIEEVLRVTQE